MNTKRPIDPQYADLREALTLPLGPEESPFVLNDEERRHRPADWAWLFLSLNPEYRDQYHKHANDRDLDLSSDLANPSRFGLKADIDGECARRFGLSVWVSPSEPKLPHLLSNDDSCFFPLMRLVTEDSCGKSVNSSQYNRTMASDRSRSETHPHIITNEGTFGYRRPLDASLPRAFGDTPGNPLDRKHDISSWSNLWVAIDCSIPPAGQIAALATLAEATYLKLKDDGNWAQHDGYWDCGVENISGSATFANIHLPPASAATSKVTDARSVWRAVVIDPLGAIAIQRDHLLQTLQKVHADLVSNGLAEKPPFERFQNKLPSKQDSDDVYRNGGSYLKALFTLAELCDLGHNDPQEIAQILGMRSTSNRYPFNWMRDFHSNIERYLDEAKQMVDSGYRLLIHAQKPDT